MAESIIPRGYRHITACCSCCKYLKPRALFDPEGNVPATVTHGCSKYGISIIYPDERICDDFEKDEGKL
jgi:hypothetical protein